LAIVKKEDCILSNVNQLCLLSFTLDGWAVLGGRVSVSLSDRVAILVGRNGAGKSAILEGFAAISLLASGWTGLRFAQIQQNNAENIPKRLDIEISTPTDRRLSYHYELISLPPDISDLAYARNDQFSWNDCCQYLDGQKELLWSTKIGLTTFADNTDSIILGNTSSFRQHNHRHLKSKNIQLPSEMQWISNILEGVITTGETSVHQLSQRRPSRIEIVRGRLDSEGLADDLSWKILGLEKDGEINELEEICRRIGIADKITVQTFASSENSEKFASILLDGVNIGLLSDGTLRILSILIGIISAAPASTIIIEEPEMHIHPGLLSKLLHEIDTYTFDKNVIISTHSPQIVSWTKPNTINLVYRTKGETIVRKLGANEVHSIAKYLDEEGDLGEWLYSGILDE
jgi:AAA domain, putative AbiEii toxin, Type IV TA system